MLVILVTALTACLPGIGDLQDRALERYVEAREEQLLQPANPDGEPVMFRVRPGDSAAVIAQRLEAEGLITDAELFRRYVRLMGIDVRLEAGDFRLSPAMNMVEIAQRLQQSRAEGILVTIPEGWRLEQIAEMLTRTAVTDGAEFRRLAESADLEAMGLGPYPFLADLPPGASLEGYLYPDTYELPLDATSVDLLRRMLDNFERTVWPAFQAATPPHDLNLHEVLTVASIVEREAVVPEERPLIASVYLNRLERNMRLEADPTVQYAMGYQPDAGQWWKTPVTLAEYAEVDSPYNTYLYAGLPPGPIASPRLSAVQAVLEPEPSDYLFFVARGDGSHVFAYTFEEHRENVRRYLGW